MEARCAYRDVLPEIDELATHFLQEATQTTSSLPPRPLPGWMPPWSARRR